MSHPRTTILLVRHADVHNPADVVYGRLPRFGLSSVGREEATRTAATLAGEPLAAIYSSPQLRARQTAETIAAHHALYLGERETLKSLEIDSAAWHHFGWSWANVRAVGYQHFVPS